MDNDDITVEHLSDAPNSHVNNQEIESSIPKQSNLKEVANVKRTYKPMTPSRL
jgi:hypothetical protein